MAQSGYTPISIYYSTTASAVPTAGNLADGELALNIADMKLYAKNSSGVVTLLAANASTTNVSSLSFGTTGLTPSASTTGAITVAGTLAVANGGTGQGTAASAFNALSPITTTGDLIIGSGVNTATRLAIGANNTVLTSNGTTASWQALTTGVTSFSAGTTGLTPRTGTTGAVTLAGTLAVANGGTGATTAAGARANLGAGTGNGSVTSITVSAGTGMSGGGTVTTSGTVTLTNAGVTSVTAGTGISVSASTGGVTISNTASSGAQAFVAFGSTGGY